MGVHPQAPSMVAIDEHWQPLSDWIASDPQAILGRTVSRKFNNQLPYLFKVLAIAKPLSIQAHPNRQQAQARLCQRESPADSPEGTQS